MDVNMKIADAAATNIRHPKTTNANDVTRLGASRYLQGLRSVKSRCLESRSERTLAKRQWYLAVEFMPIPTQKRMFKNVNDAVAVARRSTACPWLTFTTEPYADIVVNTWWYGDLSFYSDFGEPMSSAGRAFFANCFSCTSTSRACCLKTENA
jgi:hypothetical protein